MLFVCAFNPTLVLAAVMRELLGDFVWSTWRSGTLVSIRVELHELPDSELVHFDHRVCLSTLRTCSGVTKNAGGGVDGAALPCLQTDLGSVDSRGSPCRIPLAQKPHTSTAHNLSSSRTTGRNNGHKARQNGSGVIPPLRKGPRYASSWRPKLTIDCRSLVRIQPGPPIKSIAYRLQASPF